MPRLRFRSILNVNTTTGLKCRNCHLARLLRALLCGVYKGTQYIDAVYTSLTGTVLCMLAGDTKSMYAIPQPVKALSVYPRSDFKNKVHVLVSYCLGFYFAVSYKT